MACAQPSLETIVHGYGGWGRGGSEIYVAVYVVRVNVAFGFMSFRFMLLSNLCRSELCYIRYSVVRDCVVRN